jgi:hypothetical protein
MVRRLEFEAMEASKPAREAQEAAASLAAAKRAEWERQVKEALRNGETPPTCPDDAREPEPIPLPRLVVGDNTPERLGTILRDNPKGVLVYRDEIAGWLSSFGRYSSDAGGERAMWLEAYGGRPYSIDRQKLPEPIIPRLSTSVLGGIQPNKLALVTSGADDGLAGRCLYVWPDPVTGFRLQRQGVDGTLHFAALQRLHGLSLMADEAGALQPAYIPLSDPAAALLESYVVEIKKRAAEAMGLMASTLGKAAGYAVRLALVLEYLDWSEAMLREEPKKIGESAMEAAICLIDGYFLPMAQRTFGEASIPEEDKRAMELARWIWRERPPRFNARETRRSMRGGLKDAKAMNQACEVLTQAGWIRPVERAPGGSGGRTPSDYEVNPTLFAQEMAA